MADGSDYSAGEADYENDGPSSVNNDGDDDGEGMRRLNAMDAPTVEEEPVGPSKNAGQRFLAVVWDDRVDTQGRSREALHELRVDTMTDHVLYCRKANLYNETFNYNSMADVFWSYPLLSSDLGCFVGHAYCIDSNTVEDARNLLRHDPMVQAIRGNDDDKDDLSNICLYKWRHIKDHTLRQDPGRHGSPTLVLNLHHDDADEDDAAAREEHYDDHLRYLIGSERVIQAGPLYAVEEEGTPLGDVTILNAEGRHHAVDFAEHDPLALQGLYGTMRVHRFNDLDVTGKFASTNQMVDEDVRVNNVEYEMREALEYWGYPIEDRQTKWVNR